MGILNCIIRRKVCFKIWIVLCMLLNTVTPQNTDDNRPLSSCELENLVTQLINPKSEYQMHALALRNQLRNILQNDKLQTYQNLDDSADYIDEDKRSVSSLARSGIIPSYGKRYLGALARSGMMSSSVDPLKRSLANLAKNGQLPTQEPNDSGSDEYKSPQWNEKRNLGALAKSGGLTSGKRNIGTLARDFQLPSNGGKRNVAALARSGLVPKRNLAALARLNSYYQEEKRNLGALKNSPVHGTRQKRDMIDGIDYEVPDEVIQNYSDYDDLRNSLNRLYGGPYEEKRFLGSVAKNGWFRNIDKRNIGSLARLGLLRSDYNRYGKINSRDSYQQRQEQKRHIGALARSDFSPNKSDYDNPTRPFVGDATIKHIKHQNLVGVHQDQITGEHHPDLQHYIGEVYDQQPKILTFKNINKIPKNNYDNNLELSNFLLPNNNNNDIDDDDNNNFMDNNNNDIDYDENMCNQRLNFMLNNLYDIEDSSIDNKNNNY